MECNLVSNVPQLFLLYQPPHRPCTVKGFFTISVRMLRLFDPHQSKSNSNRLQKVL